MTPLLDLEDQQRYRELGRLRMGRKALSSKGKEYPEKLLNWRVTSPSRPLLEVIANLYGGEVEPWPDAPQQGENWQVTTESPRLRIALPPGDVLSQHYELWSGGGCKRRCDGINQLLVARPCACPKELSERQEAAQAKPGSPPSACQPVSRLSVLLPDVPDVGVWRLESHGYNAAIELRTTYRMLEAVLSRGLIVEAGLRIEPRTSKKDGKTSHFTVPVIEFEHTSGQLADILMVEAGEDLPALAAAPVEPKAFSSAPAPALHTDEPQQTGIPQWLQDMPGDDPEILDAALEIWVARGGDPEGLTGLAQLANMDVATQQELRARILANRQKPVPEPDAVADAWDPPAEPEQERLV